MESTTRSVLRLVACLMIGCTVAIPASAQSVVWTKKPDEGVKASAGKIVAECKIQCAVTLPYEAWVYALGATGKPIYKVQIPEADFSAPQPLPCDPSRVTVTFPVTVATIDRRPA